MSNPSDFSLSDHAAEAQLMKLEHATKLVKLLNSQDSWRYESVWTGNGYIIRVCDEAGKLLGYL